MNRIIRTGVLALAALSATTALRAQLVIGQTAGFTGSVAASIKETSDGARLWIDSVNAKGGVNGQKIELVQMDDKFDPKLTLANATRLVEEKHVLALFLTRGTPHNEGIIPLLEKDGVPLIAPSTGAMSLHKPVHKQVFNVRATYQREAERAIDYLAQIGVNRLAVVIADDSFGTDVAQGITRAFERNKLQPVASVKADRAKPDYATIVPTLVKAEPHAVLWIGSGNAVADGIKALRTAGSQAQVVTLSNNAATGFVKSLGDAKRGVIVTQVFPYERSIDSPFVREALEMARAKGLDNAVSPAFLEGFAGAKVLVEGLRRAGKNPTRASLQAALEGMQKFDLGGLDISYSSADHSGLDFADLSIISADGKFRR